MIDLPILPILQLVVLVWIAVLIREVVLRLNTILAHQAARDLLASGPVAGTPAPPMPPAPAAAPIQEILRTPVGRELLRARLEARLKRQAREGPARGD